MNQSINLYKHLDQHQTLPFSALHVAISVGATLVLTLLVVIFCSWQLSSLSSELLIAKQQKQVLGDQLQLLQGQINGDLLQKIELLKQKLAEKRRILASLELRKPGDNSGFSEQMAGLGRQQLTGLWLDRIQLSAGGEQLALNGVMRKASLLPKYLQSLGNEKVFSGIRFDLMRIEDIEQLDNQMRFEVAFVIGQPIDSPPKNSTGAAREKGIKSTARFIELNKGKGT